MTTSQLNHRIWATILPKSEAKLNRLLLITFFLVGLIGIIHHEMWHDEFQAWLIARDSNSLAELRENIEYVGHPILWYLCLYILNIFTNNPFFVQLLHLVIATAVVGVFLKFSPFKIIQKSLFCFGYFPLYEYGIISRNYNLGLLLIFIFCAWFSKRDRGYLPLAIALALLSHTNLYGLIVGFSLACFLVVDAITNRELFRNLYAKRWNIATSLSIYGLGLISAILQILPPKNAGYKADIITPMPGEEIVSLADHIRRCGKAITGIWNSYVPLPSFDLHYWNTNILDSLAINIPILGLEGIYWSDIVILLLSVVLIVFSILLFIRRPTILFLYLLGTTLMMLCAYSIRSPSMRHSGHFFILLLICYWLAAYLPKRRRRISKRQQRNPIYFFSRNKNQILTIILCIHLLAGIFVYTKDLFMPFSASKQAVNYIRDNQLEHLIIVGSEDARTSPLSAQLNKQLYYPESEEFGSYTVWTDKKRKRDLSITHSDILQQVAGLITPENSKILLVLDKQLDAQLPSLKILPLSQFEPSVVKDEVYYLYVVTKSVS